MKSGQLADLPGDSRVTGDTCGRHQTLQVNCSRGSRECRCSSIRLVDAQGFAHGMGESRRNRASQTARAAARSCGLSFDFLRAIPYTLGSTMQKRFFDQIEVGETHETPGITVTDWHVMNFAAVSMDFFELHTNDEYARQTQFGRRVAHGLMGLAIADGLKHRSAFQVDAIASLHWSWDFTGPIYIGDTIRARLQVMDKRASKSRPDRGVVAVDFEVLNQRDEVVQKGTNRMMVKRC